MEQIKNKLFALSCLYDLINACLTILHTSETIPYHAKTNNVKKID